VELAEVFTEIVVAAEATTDITADVARQEEDQVGN